MFYTVNFPILILDLIIGANMTEQAALLEKIPTRISNSEIVTLVPMLRADFEAFETYQPSNYQLDCPIIAFGGLNDPRVSPDQLESWASHTTTDFRSQNFSGDHFFINTYKANIITSINSELTSTHASK